MLTDVNNNIQKGNLFTFYLEKFRIAALNFGGYGSLQGQDNSFYHYKKVKQKI